MGKTRGIEDGMKYWRHDDGRRRIPEEKDRKKKILDTHEKLVHRAAGPA